MRKLKRAVIKEEFVELTGDQTEAILLNQLVYWTERIGFKRYNKWIEEESTRNIGDNNIKELEGGWIYKKIEEINDEIMSTVSDNTISRKLNNLKDKGYIFKRPNPENKWDKVFQYRINALKLIKDLEKLGYHLQDYKYSEVLQSLSLSKSQFEDSTCQNEVSNLQFEGSLPKITTKTTNRTNNKNNNKGDLKKVVDNFSSAFGKAPNNLQIQVIQKYMSQGLSVKLIDKTIRSCGIGGHNQTFFFNKLKRLVNDNIFTVGDLDSNINQKNTSKPATNKSEDSSADSNYKWKDFFIDFDKYKE